MDMQIQLSPELKAKIEHAASVCGMSVPEFVCESLEWMLAQKLWDDALFADDAVYRGDAPADLAVKHDEYLYGIFPTSSTSDKYLPPSTATYTPRQYRHN